MKLPVILAATAMAVMASSTASAQFAAPSRAKPSVTSAKRPTSLADQQRTWAVEAARASVARVSALPRTTTVANTVQRQITAYAPSGGVVGYAQAWTADDCERSIRSAEDKYGLPPYLLAAIALTESGYNGRPNPFAMNITGKAHYAKGTDEMEAVVARSGGEKASIDVGCLQINLRWHSDRFRDWRSLLVPRYNAEYAALYLTELKKRYGTWNAAVGAYHSRTPWKSANYACLVSRRWSQIFGSVRPGCGADIEAMSRLMYATRRS